MRLSKGCNFKIRLRAITRDPTKEKESNGVNLGCCTKVS